MDGVVAAGREVPGAGPVQRRVHQVSESVPDLWCGDMDDRDRPPTTVDRRRVTQV